MQLNSPAPLILYVGISANIHSYPVGCCLHIFDTEGNDFCIHTIMQAHCRYNYVHAGGSWIWQCSCDRAWHISGLRRRQSTKWPQCSLQCPSGCLLHRWRPHPPLQLHMISARTCSPTFMNWLTIHYKNLRTLIFMCVTVWISSLYFPDGRKTHTYKVIIIYTYLYLHLGHAKFICCSSDIYKLECNLGSRGIQYPHSPAEVGFTLNKNLYHATCRFFCLIECCDEALQTSCWWENNCMVFMGG